MTAIPAAYAWEIGVLRVKPDRPAAPASCLQKTGFTNVYALTFTGERIGSPSARSVIQPEAGSP
jgi:hypothetical protein